VNPLFIPKSTTKSFRVRMVGGGGGGSGNGAGTGGGNSGAAGCYQEFLVFNVESFYGYFVGAKGNGGSTGSAGGPTGFNTQTEINEVTGGNGGPAVTSASLTPASGGTVSYRSLGIIVNEIPGASGNIGVLGSGGAPGAIGASGPWGGAGGGSSGSAAARPAAVNSGSGGGGGGNSIQGSDGGSGVIIIEEYSI
jgi:hypothetical protein